MYPGQICSCIDYGAPRLLDRRRESKGHHARQTSGLGRFQLILRKNRPDSVNWKAYGALETTATLAHMKITVTVGAEDFTNEADWVRLMRGWNNADSNFN